jgi:hypothetical protein
MGWGKSIVWSTSKSEGDIMYHVLMCAAAGALFISTAKGDETLKFRIVGHATSFQSEDVGDVDGHALILMRLSGLASFPDGSVAPVNWTLTGDDTKGDGTWMTYVNVALLDGSVLRYKATGSSKASGPITGSLTVLGGKGRFEGAKGDGSINGSHPPETGPNAYFDIVINIKK